MDVSEREEGENFDFGSKEGGIAGEWRRENKTKAIDKASMESVFE